MPASSITCKGAELILGSGNDTANVDDTGSVGPKTGFLTAFATPAGQVAPAGALTGLNMGAMGIAYSGLSNFNITLGAGGLNQPTSPVVGNTFDIDVPSGLNLPADTTVFGGPSNNDAVTGVWGTNFNTLLNLYQFEHGNGLRRQRLHRDDERPAAGRPPAGHGRHHDDARQRAERRHHRHHDNRAEPSWSSATISRDMSTCWAISVRSPSPAARRARSPRARSARSRSTAATGRSWPRSRRTASSARLTPSAPNYPYAAPNPAALPSPSASSYVNFEYFYEGLATVLGNPQLTARVTNGVGTSADQYDFALITDNDVAKFNLARLDAIGVAGVRNVEVEGDLLTTITAAAQAFFGLPSNQGGVRLPSDNLAGVEIRDYAPPDSIQAKSIQGVAFGSTTRFTINHVIYGSTEVASDAANLLVLGTAIVQANDTFLVPFADVMNQQVGFFIDDTPTPTRTSSTTPTSSSPSRADNGQQENVDRGAVTALVTDRPVKLPYFVPLPDTIRALSIIQTIDLRGDGGSMISRQWVAQGITSTGPLGDVAIDVALGMTNVTAPSFFGNIRLVRADHGHGPVDRRARRPDFRHDFDGFRRHRPRVCHARDQRPAVGHRHRDPDRHQRPSRLSAPWGSPAGSSAGGI